jgi:hypothetical protein
MKFMVTVVAFLSILWSGVDADGCSFVSPYGVPYDLTALSNPKQDYWMQNQQNKYWLNLCRPTVAQACGNTSACCQQATNGYWSLSAASTISWSLNAKQQPMASFTGGDQGRVMDITFVCDPTTVIGQPQFVSESPQWNYHLSWNTALACACLAGGCQGCTGNYTYCEWCLDTSSCVPRVGNPCQDFVTSPKYCPGAKCPMSTTCTTCLSNDVCGWCLDKGVCFDKTYGFSCNNVITNKKYCGLKVPLVAVP